MDPVLRRQTNGIGCSIQRGGSVESRNTGGSKGFVRDPNVDVESVWDKKERVNLSQRDRSDVREPTENIKSPLLEIKRMLDNNLKISNDFKRNWVLWTKKKVKMGRIGRLLVLMVCRAPLEKWKLHCFIGTGFQFSTTQRKLTELELERTAAGGGTSRRRGAGRSWRGEEIFDALDSREPKIPLH
jgi:hypothetical protein